MLISPLLVFCPGCFSHWACASLKGPQTLYLSCAGFLHLYYKLWNTLNNTCMHFSWFLPTICQGETHIWRHYWQHFAFFTILTQIDSMLPYVCLKTDHKRQQLIRSLVIHSAAPRVPLFSFDLTTLQVNFDAEKSSSLCKNYLVEKLKMKIFSACCLGS